MSNRSTRFRSLMMDEPFVATTGVHAPLEAKIAQSAGLKALFLSGYSCSLGYLGRADLGFVTMSEMTGWARTVSAATDLPIIADGDDGYGNALLVTRTIEEFERAGVAGVTIEDQQFPKRCGHLKGKRCLPVNESVLKVKAALDARSDPEFVIIARTDAVNAEGGSLEQAIDRAKRYADVGADLVWPEFPTPSRGDVARFAEEVRAQFPNLTLMFNYSSSFKWGRVENPWTFAELAELGYKFIILGLGSLHAAMYAEWNFMKDLTENHEKAQVRLESMIAGHPTESHHAMGRAEHFLEVGNRYAAPER